MCPPLWSPLQIHALTPSTKVHILASQCPTSILLRSSYSSTPHRIDTREKERKSTEGEVSFTTSKYCIFIFIFILELPDFFYILQYLINFKQKRKINMRSRNSMMLINTNKNPVEITKQVLDFILCLIMSSSSCSCFYILAHVSILLLKS